MKIKLNLPAKNYETFSDCNKYVVYHSYLLGGKIVSQAEYYPMDSGLLIFGGGKGTDYLKEWDKLQIPKDDLGLTIVYSEKKELQKKCIKNSKFYILYKVFPKIFGFIEDIQQGKKYKPGTSVSVNPFIYGEVSISNIVKRYPINYIFKPLLFVTSLLMIFYWLTYQKIFWNISNDKKINMFTFFGVLSGLFLFFHVLFLGSTIDNDIFQKMRKLILVLFILFEILAQFFLTKRLYLNIDKFNNYISKRILNIKIIFVGFIIISSAVIIGILSFNNLDSKIDYILEWNYFALLLFFYLLSALMWIKRDKNSIL
tara:strand:- start:26 stop:964 length:939 start_codon:yes stop_codon:yes gene_type:complete